MFVPLETECVTFLCGVRREWLGNTGPGLSISEREAAASMGNAHIGGISLGGILVIVGIVLAILLGHWWIGLIIVLLGLVFFGGFAKGKWY
jgi:hypothetical protein